MKQLRSVKALKEWRLGRQNTGFVPTMGALHSGHMQLVERALAECGNVVVSIFVNPAQFNDENDLAKYPRPIERDLQLINKAGVQAVFLPDPREMYADDYRFEVREKQFSRELCGAARPGHFEGVLTVVLKLLNLVRPERAYFGEKDYQQLTLIREMAKAFFLPVEVIGCPTIREPDGLAMSSRNLLLSAAERERAPFIYKTLRSAPTAEQARMELEKAGFRVDYVVDREGRRFAAAFLGSVRLIDNVEI